MKRWTDTYGDLTIIDCSTISLSYQPTGFVNMSFKAYRSGTSLPYGDGELNFNMCISKNKRFKGLITQQQISPTLEFEDVKEWSVTVLGIVCFDAACGGQSEC